MGTETRRVAHASTEITKICPSPSKQLAVHIIVHTRPVNFYAVVNQVGCCARTEHPMILVENITSKVCCHVNNQPKI